MVSLYVPGDYVKYKDAIYRITKVIYSESLFKEGMFIYGLTPLVKDNYSECILIREELLIKVDPPFDNKLMRVLYED